MNKLISSVTLTVLLVTQSAYAAPGDVTTLEAPDGSTVVIYRDLYGVPHVRAETEAAAFYGQGYAVAEDRLFQMETFRRTALGRLSEVGLGTLATDRQIRATTYTSTERSGQYARLSEDARTMIDSYVAGINAYLTIVAQDPMRLRPAEFFAPSLGFSEADPRPWTTDDVVAVIQFLMRRFGQYGGEEIMRLGELNTYGPEWFEVNRPINDPLAPTTIPGSSAAAMPSTASAAKTTTSLHVDPSVVAEFDRRSATFESDLAAIGVPPRLGSIAAVISKAKSQTGNVMLLGAPQLTPPELGQTNITHEVELDARTLHVAGMTVAGIPGVIVGHTEHLAWTLTSGNSDNTDTFVEILNATGSAYLHSGTFHGFEVIPEPDLGFARLRTVHGPVIMHNPAAGQAFSWQLTFWDRELEMVDAFYQAWKATSLSGFEAAMAAVPMNFNILYAGKDQKIKYFHVGTLLRNTQTLESHDPRLPRLGDGSQEWGDDPFLAFHELPQASGDVQDYFTNWNNKPAPAWNNGDNIPWSLVFRHERTARVQRINDFIGPLNTVTFEDVKSIPFEIEDHGTYQQAIEFTPSFIRNVNVVPPGQSGFISPLTGPSPHRADQWALHELWAYKNMVFNEPMGLWPPDNRLVAIDLASRIDAGDPAQAFVETVWIDEGSDSGQPVVIEDCRTLRLAAERDGAGNGRVYTVHLAAPDPAGRTGTAALFQVVVPKSPSPVHAYAVDDGPVRTVEGGCAAPGEIAQAFPSAARLDQNRPNPFNPTTQIRFELREPGHAVLAVYNVLGQEVRRLVDGVQNAGSHSVTFDAQGLSSGVYLYVLRTTELTFAKTMIFQK